MEKTVTHNARKNIDKHQFYCDECNKFLGTSIEYADGYYETHGDFMLRIWVEGEWYTLQKCLCDQCRAAKIDALVKFLKGFGFSNRFEAE